MTNGLGGYASSTVLNINTRKYHGLLIAAFNPPVDRRVQLSKIDEEVWIGDDGYPFGSNEFRDTIHPEGYKRIRSFATSPFPTFSYQVSGVYLKKTVFMPHMRNMVVIKYEALNSLSVPAVINLYPLVNARHFYETTKRHSQQLKILQEPVLNGVMLENKPSKGYLALLATDGRYNSSGDRWIERLYYRVDDSRGESCIDDNYQPGFFTVKVPPKETKDFFIAATAGRTKEEIAQHHTADLGKNLMNLHREEIIRRERLLKMFYENKADAKPEDWLNWLILSADSFIVRRESTGANSVIAGYHWFEDWGRDTLISLPGLTLVTGRFRDAEEILLTFKHYCRDGLLPNRFPDRTGDEPVYDSVDATLWFFNAVFQYLKYTGRTGFVHAKLWDTMQDMVEHLMGGTAFGICMDDDGLLLHGPRLTWMDASVDGRPVTSREGKAVEIQALWYNVLRIMEKFALIFNQGDDAQRYGSFAEKTRRSFNAKFWRSEGNYLLDVVEKGVGDPSLRPNQIIVASLDFCMLDKQRRAKVVEAVWRGLWGTYGLKTLSSDDPRFVGKYGGGFVQRDEAYHNGTVWAWLLGPFVTAFLKAKNHGEYWRKFAFKKFLQPLFFEQTYRAGLGTLSEIFDGELPHSPRGCISQAWSVAEPLRAFVEDILLKRPSYEKNLNRNR